MSFGRLQIQRISYMVLTGRPESSKKKKMRHWFIKDKVQDFDSRSSVATHELESRQYIPHKGHDPFHREDELTK